MAYNPDNPRGPYRIKDPAIRFFRDVTVTTSTDECWPWKGLLDRNGYGRFNLPRSAGKEGAHRWAYEYLIGPAPKGLVSDHRCHTDDLSCLGGLGCPHRRCCNPWHLEFVTSAENLARARNWHLNQTHCKWGHPFSGDNLVMDSKGARDCRACRYRRGQDAFRKRKAAAAHGAKG